MYENIITKTVPIEERHKQIKFQDNVPQKVLVEDDLVWLYSSSPMGDCPKSVIGWLGKLNVRLIENNKISNEVHSILNSSTLLVKLSEIANDNHLESLKGKVMNITKTRKDGKIGWNVSLIK